MNEKKPLGTAGSLLLLKNKIKKPFIVTNCDTFINTDINKLYKFHLKNKFDLTLVASSKIVTIPYGKCSLDSDGNLDYIDEKPKLNYLVNTGMYIINPDILKMTTGGGNSPMRNSDVQTDISHGVPSSNRRNRQPSMSPGSRYVYIQSAAQEIYNFSCILVPPIQMRG